MRTTNARAGIIGFVASYLSGRRSLAGSMEKHLDSMVMVASGASRNVRIVRIYPLTVLFTFTMVIIYCILGLIIQLLSDECRQLVMEVQC